MEKLTAVSVRFSYTDKLNNRLTTFDLVCSARHWRNSRQVKKSISTNSLHLNRCNKRVYLEPNIRNAFSLIWLTCVCIYSGALFSDKINSFGSSEIKCFPKIVK